jgi:hypothetical protein
MMEHTTITLPAYWCSALINGDYSGLDDAEGQRCRAIVIDLASDGWSIVSCEDEARFTWHYALYDPGADCEGGDVLDYDILRAPGPAKRTLAKLQQEI